ncbi:hypothetical protein [Streptomyces acidicola]|uniref:hypothetical protein n=1 Tax=Streptomyces acidicola TaxID=2596892 RepID=UPI003432D864
MDVSRTWQISVDGPIVVGPTATDTKLEHLYDKLSDDSTYDAPEPAMPELRTVATDLVATGRWTDADTRMKCPKDGHEWTDELVDRRTGLTMMQALIKGATPPGQAEE